MITKVPGGYLVQGDCPGPEPKETEKKAGFWCDCAEPKAVHFEYRGHSVDVGCICGGWLQIG